MKNLKWRNKIKGDLKCNIIWINKIIYIKKWIISKHDEFKN